jgi:hypothetical protein
MLTDDQFSEKVTAQLRAELAGIRPAPDLLQGLHRRQARRTWSLRIGFTAVPAAVAGIAAAVVVVGGAPATPAGPTPVAGSVPSHASLRTAILTAYDTAEGEILYDYQVAQVGGQTQVNESWFSPADPEPGQVETSRELGLGAAGEVEEDTVVSFRVPSRPLSNVVFKTTDVVYGTRSWSDTQATVTYKPITTDAATVRQQIAAGRWSVAGTGSLDGRRVIKLTWHVTGGPVDDLWVDANTYLPVESVLTDTVGAPGHTVKDVFTDQYTYLAPTAANMAKLQVSVPSGFTRTAQPDQPSAPGGGKG